MSIEPILPPPEKLVGALSSGLNVLRYLSAAEGRVSVTRVARDLGLNSSTCFNILRTLVHERLLSFDSESKTYAIALGLVELAKGALEQASYVRMIHHELVSIASTHNVTATLWQRVPGDRVVLVDRAESPAAIRVHMSIGQRLPMFIAALGRCMAAHSGLSAGELEKRFASLRWDDPPSFARYLKEVELARKNDYAIDPGRYVKGATTISAAILNADQRPIMAISAIGFSAQFNKEQINTLALDVRDRAYAVTRAITGRAAPPKAA